MAFLDSTPSSLKEQIAANTIQYVERVKLLKSILKEREIVALREQEQHDESKSIKANNLVSEKNENTSALSSLTESEKMEIETEIKALEKEIDQNEKQNADSDKPESEDAADLSEFESRKRKIDKVDEQSEKKIEQISAMLSQGFRDITSDVENSQIEEREIRQELKNIQNGLL